MLPFFLISWATLHASSSLVGILMATNPLMVLVLVHLFLPDEPIRPRHVAGFAFGFTGVVLLIGPGATDCTAIWVSAKDEPQAKTRNASASLAIWRIVSSFPWRQCGRPQVPETSLRT